jgi:hypothetical protein
MQFLPQEMQELLSTACWQRFSARKNPGNREGGYNRTQIQEEFLAPLPSVNLCLGCIGSGYLIPEL